MKIGRAKVRRNLTAVLLLALLSIGLGACTPFTEKSPATAPPLNVSHAPVPGPQSGTKVTPPAANTTTIYWLGRGGDSEGLYPEPTSLNLNGSPLEPGGDLLTTAAKYIMSSKPYDRSYWTPWSKPSRLAVSLSTDEEITIDMSSDAFARTVDAATAGLALQQMVYTLTEVAANASLIKAAQSTSVLFLVDGLTGYIAFDHIKLAEQALTRDPNAPGKLWVYSPQESAHYSATSLTLSGRLLPNVIDEQKPATVSLLWSIDRLSPAQETTTPSPTDPAEYLPTSPAPTTGEILNGRLTAENGGGLEAATGNFTVPLALAAGDYVLHIYWTVADKPQAEQSRQVKKFTVI